MKYFYTLMALMLWFTYSIFAQLPLSTTVPVTEDFNSIGISSTASLPPNWKVDKQANVRTTGTWSAATSSTERAGSRYLASNAGNGVYNFGAPDSLSSERAIGFLSSSSATKSGNLYVHLVNSATTTLSGVKISYKVEKYRKGSNTAGFMIQLYYSFDGVNFTTAGDDFLVNFSADGATEGYETVPGDSVVITDKVLPVSLPKDSSLYLCWNYSVRSGITTSFSQALAIDDISILGIVNEIDNPPTISTVTSNKKVPLATEDLVVQASITDDNSVSGAYLLYRINQQVIDSVAMSVVTGTTYSATLNQSLYNDGDFVEYAVAATDNAGQYSVTAFNGFLAGVTPISKLKEVDINGVPKYRNYYARTTGVATIGSGIFQTSHLEVFLQDTTGGIDLFKSGAGSFEIVKGNSYTVVGIIDHYNGKTEIIPDNVSDITDNGISQLPEPVTITIAQLLSSFQQSEQLEGSLIRLVDVAVVEGTWPRSTAFSNVTVSDDGGTSTLTLRANSVTGGTTQPQGLFDVVGILVQYDNSSPYTSGYQIMPRALIDFYASIAASVVGNGTITPSGIQKVSFGSSIRFLFAPHDSTKLDSVLVNGVKIDSTEGYTFSDINSNATIVAYFSSKNQKILATSNQYGTIIPSGEVFVPYGGSQQFMLVPNAHCKFDSLLVDGVKVDSTESYTFINVTADHTIEAYFSPIGFVITASANEFGSITPSGSVVVPAGGNQRFEFMPNEHCVFDSLLVDGVLVDSTTSYTFENVTTNHTIQAYFSLQRFTIIATAYGEGTITPSGSVVVPYGGSQVFTIVPHTNHKIDSVVVDGIKVDSTNSYTFSNVQANHTIAVYFSLITGVDELLAHLPHELKLYPGFPNPFNPATYIQFTVEKTDVTVAEVYNVLGQKVATLFNETAEAGRLYKVRFEASHLPSGVFYVLLQNAGKRAIQKVMLLK